MKDNLENYQDLIDDESGRYVLIQTVKGSDEVETCVVYDKQTRTGLIVEDDEIFLQLKTKLREQGIPILDELPK